MKLKFKIKIYILSILILLLCTLLVFKSNSYLSDWFSLNISQYLVTTIGTFTSALPFSLFELVIIAFLIVLCAFLITLIKYIIKIKVGKIINLALNLALTCLIIINLFISICGVSYQRSEIELPFYKGEVTSSLVDETINYYLNDYNEIVSTFSKDENGISKCPYTFEELSNKMIDECSRLDQFDYFYKFDAKAKGTWFSPLLSELHITGVDFPFTAEANVNVHMPTIDLPFTIAHEMAHLKGVMREDDANTVALYVCITSSDPYIRYSGYFRGFSRLLEIKAYTEHKAYLEFLPLINQQIYTDQNDYFDFYEEHNLLDDVSKFFNDLYLSLNGEKEGTSSYDDISQSEGTGNYDEDGYEIRVYTNYSKYQLLMIQNYLDNN